MGLLYWKDIKINYMKRIIFSLCFVFALTVCKAQYVEVVDNSFNPTIDTSVHSMSACQLQPFRLSVLGKDTVSVISATSLSDNLSKTQGYANINVQLMNSNLSVLNSFTFTIQGDNYSEWNSDEYLFKVIATYIYQSKGYRIQFR